MPLVATTAATFILQILFHMCVTWATPDNKFCTGGDAAYGIGVVGYLVWWVLYFKVAGHAYSNTIQYIQVGVGIFDMSCALGSMFLQCLAPCCEACARLRKGKKPAVQILKPEEPEEYELEDMRPGGLLAQDVTGQA